MTQSAIEIRPRRAAVHALTVSFAFGLAVLSLVTTADNAAACVCLLYIAVVTPELCRVDWLEHRLPNTLVGPGYVVVAVAVVGEWQRTSEFPILVCVSGAGYLGTLLVFHLCGGMGMGDVKLGGLLGCAGGFMGINTVILSPLIAFVCGGIAASMLLVRGGAGNTRIPFGPFLLAGLWLAVAVVPVVENR